MYFEESLRLMGQFPASKNAIKSLDRELAHAYLSDGTGHIQVPSLAYLSGVTAPSLRSLLDQYAALGAVAALYTLICECEADYDPDGGSCPACGRDSAIARVTNSKNYRIVRRPIEPAYDPMSQPYNPDVFVSYRRDVCSRLAADIFYSLRAEGRNVFLDTGSIPEGAEGERVYTQAASTAPHFVALVSATYFDSPFCLQEIAHAMRARQRLIWVNVPPAPAAPSEMPWLSRVQRHAVDGQPTGLQPELEQSLHSALSLNTSSNTPPMADLRREACEFLLDKLPMTELERVRNRLSWLQDIDFSGSKPQRIGRILAETTAKRLSELCVALAP